MHKVPQAVQFRYAALTFILAPGYVQIITLEASQPRDRLTSAAFRSVTSVIIFCLVPSMKTFTAGVSKGGVQKFNGHLYWFSWQVNNLRPFLSFQKTFIVSLQDNDANVKNAKWDWFNARNYCRCRSSHTFASKIVEFLIFRKRCMDLVSFETQQEYDWVKGFINGESQIIQSR